MSVRFDSILTRFDGQASWADWYERFETVADLEAWNDDMKLKVLQYYIGPIPSKFIRSIPVKERTIESIVKRMSDVYQPNEVEALTLLKKRTLRAEESPEELWFDLVYLWRCSTQQLSAVLSVESEFLAVRPLFLDAVSSSVATQLRMQGFKTAEELFQLARTLIAAERAAPEQTVVAAVKGSAKTHGGNWGRKGKGKRYPEKRKTCRKCGSVEHETGDCRHEGNVCFKCGVAGHFMKDCNSKNGLREGTLAARAAVSPSH